MQHHSPTDNPDVHHEESDVDIATILKFGMALAVVAAVIHVLIWGVLTHLDRSQSITTRDFPMAAGETRTPPGPQLQVTPRDDLRELIVRDEAVLASYTWVDRNQGIVRIPIDVAIRLTLERGLPARDANTETAGGTSTSGTPTADPVVGAPQP